jgi:hypothetical protein
MVRFNMLKIYILAGEAKPGGMIGAMLSPYLFSLNMTDFCKKFNELTKDYNNTVWLGVHIFTDIIEKVYLFEIKGFSFSMFFTFYFENNFLENRNLDIIFLYDLTLFHNSIYKFNIYLSALYIYCILKTFKKYFFFFNFSDIFLSKVN